MFKWERECFMLLSLPAWAKLRVRSRRIWQELELSRKSESSPTPIHSLCSEDLERCKLRLYECLRSWLYILHQCIVRLPVWSMQGEWTINGTELTLHRNRDWPERVHSVCAYMSLCRLFLKGKISLCSWSEKARGYWSRALTGLLGPW